MIIHWSFSSPTATSLQVISDLPSPRFSTPPSPSAESANSPYGLIDQHLSRAQWSHGWRLTAIWTLTRSNTLRWVPRTTYRVREDDDLGSTALYSSKIEGLPISPPHYPVIPICRYIPRHSVALNHETTTSLCIKRETREVRAHTRSHTNVV